MTIDPKTHKPAATFDEEMRVEPPQLKAAQAQFRLALYSDAPRTNLLGYLAWGADNYAHIAPRGGAAILETYQHYNITTYRTETLGIWRYLSVSTFAYVGWYLWNGATGWTLQPNGRFTSEWNGQNLSVYDVKAPGEYLYAWDPYPQLFVNVEHV